MATATQVSIVGLLRDPSFHTAKCCAHVIIMYIRLLFQSLWHNFFLKRVIIAPVRVAFMINVRRCLTQWGYSMGSAKSNQNAKKWQPF